MPKTDLERQIAAAKRQIAAAKRQENEQALWTQIKQLSLPSPLAECQGDDTRFLEGCDYRADLWWPGWGLIVEVDGGTHSGGRHVRGVGYEEDRERDTEASIAGFTTLRFTAGQIEDGYAVQAIERWLNGNVNPVIKAALQEERKRLALVALSWQPCWGADPGYAAVRSDIAALILED